MYDIGIAEYTYDFNKGLIMGGYSARAKPSEGTHDPIRVRALYIKDPESHTAALLIEGDFIGLNAKRVERLKEEFSERYNIPYENILIAIIHTHSSVLNINLFTEPTEGVLEKIDEGFREVVKDAIHSTFKGEVRIYKGKITGVSFNRRDWDPSSDILNEETIVLCIYDEQKTCKAIIYNYSCHPVVMGPDNLLLSEDWPYFTEQWLKRELNNADLFVMFLQGTPGNLNPRNRPLSGDPKNTFKDCEEIGNDVAQQLEKIIQREGITLQNSHIKGKIKKILIPIDDEDKVEFFEEFCQITKKGEDYFVETVVQVIIIGNLIITGLPGEIFSALAIDLKETFKDKHVMVLGYANDYIGYVGTREAYLNGGYEMIMMALSEEEGEIIINATKELISELLGEEQ